jgi:hypothetical protein
MARRGDRLLSFKVSEPSIVSPKSHRFLSSLTEHSQTITPVRIVDHGPLLLCSALETPPILQGPVAFRPAIAHGLSLSAFQ